MKPLKLLIHGFTCFREPVEIDFSDLELFAITGPTGAGKSSIVDALIFSLYGKAPRVGSDISHLISQGVSEMKIMFEFHAGKAYRIARRIGLGKSSPKVILESEENGTWKTISSKVREVNQKVTDILGLNYDAFTRSIILPQGDFQLFLNEAKSRQEILSNLLNLEIIGRIQHKAGKEKDEAKRRTERILERLDKELREVSPKALSDLMDIREKLHKDIESFSLTRESLNLKINEVKEILKLQEELKELLNVRQGIEEEGKEIERLYQSLRQARLAAPLLPLFKEKEKNDQRVNDFSLARTESERIKTGLTTEDQEIKKSIAQAEKDALDLPTINQKLQILAGLSGIIENERSLQEKLFHEKARQNNEKKERAVHLVEYEGIEKLLREKKNSLNILEENKERYRPDEGTGVRFKEAHSLLPILQAARKEMEKAGKINQENRRLLQVTDENYRRSLALLEQARSRLENAKGNLSAFPDSKVIQKKLLEAERARALSQQRAELMKVDWARKEEIENDKKEIKRIEQESHRLDSELHSLQRRKETLLGIESRLSKFLSEGMPLFSLLKKFSEQELVIKEELDILVKEGAKLNKEKDKLASKLSDIRTRLSEAVQEHDKAQAFRDEAHRSEFAAILRKSIKEGDMCPVCGQKTGPLPPSHESHVEEAEDRLKKASSVRSELQNQYTRIEEALSQKTNIQEDTLKKIEKKQKEYKEKAEEKDAVQKQLNGVLGVDSEHERFLTEVESDAEKSRKELEQVSSMLSQTESKIAASAAMLGTLKSLLEKREKALNQLREEGKKIGAEIKEITEGEEIETFVKKIQELETGLEKAKNSVLDEEKRYQHAEIEKKMIEERKAETSRRAEQSHKEAAEIDARIRKHIDEISRLTGLEVGFADSEVELKWKQYQEKEKLYNQTIEKINQVEKEISSLDIRFTKEDGTLKAITSSIEEREKRILAWEEERRGLQTRILEATDGEEPFALQQRLSKEKMRIEETLRSLREKSILVKNTLATEEKKILRLEAELNKAIEEAGETAKELEEKMNGAGFSSITMLKENLVSQGVMDQWEKEIQDYQERLGELEGRISRCKELLKGRETDKNELIRLEESLKDTQVKITENGRDLGRLAEKISRMQAELDEVEKLKKELKEIREKEEIAGQLAKDLRADKFQAYILEEALQALAEDGTGQLEILSGGRYAFTVEGREFYVIDRWNADEKRPSKTLSGGETFLASLALAVALAERIYQLGHKMGGGAVLESLFLDEGFGSLDDEHLDIVIRALENLQGGGRVIGIISHLPDLTAHVPVRLVVKKEREGSKVFREGE